MATAYKGKTLDGRAIELTVEGEKIVRCRHLSMDTGLPLMAPPLVDLQQNGARGRAFNHIHRNADTLRTVAEHVRRHGIGRLLATLTTQPFEESLQSLAALDAQLTQDGDLGRLYAGVFFEGNYMSPATGWRGAHPEEFMRNPNWTEWAALNRASGGRIKMFNIDPALPGALDTIRQAVRHGIRVAMGHCGPGPEVIRRAVEAGADMVTHFGNGAPSMIHRHRNPFWTWLADPRIRIGLIADGHHLPGDLLLAAIRAKGRDRVYLVSDTAPTSGLLPGVYADCEIEPDGLTHQIGNREILVGAWYQADRCVERMCELGWSLDEAWRQQSTIPARIMGLDLPRLEVGEPAEFVLSRWTDRGLYLEQVVSLGRALLSEAVHPRTV